LRRVASGELFLQNGSSDMREDLSDVSRGLTQSKDRVPIILSVGEDSAILYERYKVLQGAGYGVLSATEGEHALSMFEAYPVDLVLLDHAMRGPDGELVADKIKRRKQNIPVIAVSAKPISAETLSCADCVVTQEQGPLQLLQKIGQLLVPPTGRDTGFMPF
jgi:CheY-like chemotaxis protein